MGRPKIRQLDGRSTAIGHALNSTGESTHSPQEMWKTQHDREMTFFLVIRVIITASNVVCAGFAVRAVSTPELTSSEMVPKKGLEPPWVSPLPPHRPLFARGLQSVRTS